MNKQIRELAEQAGVGHIKHVGGGEWDRFLSDKEEKFAMLIVKECISVVRDAVDHREPASTYVGKIKEHFGVE